MKTRPNQSLLPILAATIICGLPSLAVAQEDDNEIKAVEVVRSPKDIAKDGGSTQVVDNKTLEAQEHDDIHSILPLVPGVYVRQEDGFGLRPNIGIRGASSERSKKITLMEDGILFGPAPYAAPAAYYFPVMTRMVGLEIYKGPGAVLFGPQTIGGALNVATRPIPVGMAGGADIALGSFPSAKLHLWHGYGWSRAGILLEGVQLGSGGFKQLDGSDAPAWNRGTGFDRSEVMLKAFVTSDPVDTIFHKVSIKATYSRERSNETYLGLTDKDFEANPERRYRASALDLMTWWRMAVRVDHRMEVGANFNLTTSLYRHDFQRSWDKFNGFADGTTAADVLDNPGSARNAIFYDVLTGKANSSSPGEQIVLGKNARQFVSQGVQTVAKHTHNGDTWHNKVEAGMRLHYDSIVRDHTETLYNMTSGELTRTPDPTRQATNNKDSALAFAAWAANQTSLWRFVLTPGLRVEYISNKRQDLNDPASTDIDGTQFVLIPGFGTTFDVGKGVRLLAGVYRGFSPVSPGQPDEVEPELSTNFEAGVRYNSKTQSRWAVRAEAIGFFNNYQNLVGQCTFAAGCNEQDLDDQFNAGQVYIYGGEFLLAGGYKLGLNKSLTFNATYTLTQTEFQSGFTSKNPQFGTVEEGDSLPYVPTHQAAAGITYDSLGFGGNFAVTYVGKMREEASQADDARFTDGYVNFDLLLSYSISLPTKFYFKGENLLDVRPIASRRPYGARPNRPRYLQVGFKYDWGAAVKKQIFPMPTTSPSEDFEEEEIKSEEIKSEEMPDKPNTLL